MGLMRVRPRKSHCPEGQEFVIARSGRLKPVHTRALGALCRCGPCRASAAWRKWTPEMVAKRSEALRARWREGRITAEGRRQKADYWTPEQDAALVEMLGRFDCRTIAERLTERFSVPRTETAVKQRVKFHGLSRLTVRPWSRVEVARALGVSYHLVSVWVDRGWLVGTPWKLGGGKRKGAISQAFQLADVERFIRAHPTLVPVGRIRDGKLKTLVQSLTRGSQPLTLPQAARMAGVSTSLLSYWIKMGRVPSAHQVDGRFWRISAADVPLLRAMPDLRTREGRQEVAV